MTTRIVLRDVWDWEVWYGMMMGTAQAQGIREFVDLRMSAKTPEMPKSPTPKDALRPGRVVTRVVPLQNQSLQRM